MKKRILVFAALSALLSGTLFAEPNPTKPTVTTSPAPKTSSSSLTDKRDRVEWALFPGIYRSYGGDRSGYEITLFHNGLGFDVAVDKQGFRYAEAELAFWLFSLGTGYRRADDGGAAGQVTWAFPILPIFPYGRWIVGDEHHKAEFGFMIKVPLFRLAPEKAG